MPMSPKIVVVGSANTDFVLSVARLPAQGETVLGEQFQVAGGGKGANQAVAAARLGAEVTLVARLGTDNFGDQSLAAYQRDGIRTDLIVRDPDVHSGVALIMVNASGENMIGVGPGANSRLTAEDVRAAEAAIQDADCLLVQLEIPADGVQAAIELAHQHHVRVILNPAPARKLPANILKLVDYLTPNESEAAVLAGEEPAAITPESLAQLASRLDVPNMIITLGSRGTCVVQDGSATLVPAVSITPVDTTAAGDAFNGALAVALAKGEHLAQAVRFANAAGALTATRPGAQPSLPRLDELERFMASSASGSNPAVRDAVDSPKQEKTRL